jgi:hypothetical protein
MRYSGSSLETNLNGNSVQYSEGVLLGPGPEEALALLIVEKLELALGLTMCEILGEQLGEDPTRSSTTGRRVGVVPGPVLEKALEPLLEEPFGINIGNVLGTKFGEALRLVLG